MFHAISPALAAAAQVPADPAAEPHTLTGSCGHDPGMTCRLAWDLMHNPSTAQFVRTYLAGPITQALRIVFVILLALLVRAVAHRLINRVTERAATATLPVTPNGRVHRAAVAVHAGLERRTQRARALGSIVRSAVSILVFGIATLTILGDLGVNLTPLLLSTTVLGVALGFGAQNLVRDVIGGFYIVLEDQFLVGDTVQIADNIGRVEHITLRRTVLRDARGALITVANGEIRIVANLSRDWSQSFVDIGLAPEIALDKPLAALESAAAELRGDPSWSQALVDGPRVLGVHSYDRHATVVRLQIRTAPTRQDEVSRELRRRIQIEFQKEGIPLASVLRFELMNPRPSAAGDLHPTSPR